jgi:hypothetical protein
VASFRRQCSIGKTRSGCPRRKSYRLDQAREWVSAPAPRLQPDLGWQPVWQARCQRRADPWVGPGPGKSPGHAAAARNRLTATPNGDEQSRNITDAQGCSRICRVAAVIGSAGASDSWLPARDFCSDDERSRNIADKKEFENLCWELGLHFPRRDDRRPAAARRFPGATLGSALR